MALRSSASSIPCLTAASRFFEIGENNLRIANSSLSRSYGFLGSLKFVVVAHVISYGQAGGSITPPLS
jgi:hypothetical protein